MKKFFKLITGKKDESKAAEEESRSSENIRGYPIKEKDLSNKLQKAAWTGDLVKVKLLAKKDPNSSDKEHRSV